MVAIRPFGVGLVILLVDVEHAVVGFDLGVVVPARLAVDLGRPLADPAFVEQRIDPRVHGDLHFVVAERQARTVVHWHLASGLAPVQKLHIAVDIVHDLVRRDVDALGQAHLEELVRVDDDVPAVRGGDRYLAREHGIVRGATVIVGLAQELVPDVTEPRRGPRHHAHSVGPLPFLLGRKLALGELFLNFRCFCVSHVSDS